MADVPSPQEIDDLLRRVENLERDNQRLREKLEPILGPDNPCFDPQQFLRGLRKAMLFMLPVYLLLSFTMIIPFRSVRQFIPPMTILGMPLVDAMGLGTRHPGVGIGIIGIGGLGIGVIGVGGFGAGIIAVGGGAFGVIALGGGSIGLIAFGGGALGYIAIGGGACGYYALGQKGAGKYVLALNRQDDPAVELFTRWIPALRAAVTRPMPVIPIAKTTSAA